MVAPFIYLFRNELWNDIKPSLLKTAPLLMHSLESKHKMTGDFDYMVKGDDAWNELLTKKDVAGQRHGEALSHDAALLLYQVKRLAADAPVADFSARINEAMTEHFPYTHMQFKDAESKSQWTLDQVPEKHGAECRTAYAALADKTDLAAVADKFVEIMTAAQRPELEAIPVSYTHLTLPTKRIV